MTELREVLGTIGQTDPPPRRRWMASDPYTGMAIGNVSLRHAIGFLLAAMVRGHGWGKLERYGPVRR
jgi:hypothetical protein